MTKMSLLGLSAICMIVFIYVDTIHTFVQIILVKNGFMYFLHLFPIRAKTYAYRVLLSKKTGGILL